MGGQRSGTPPSREVLEAAIAAVGHGMSQRAAAKRFGVDRGTLAKYLEDPVYRRKERRCPSCGVVVAWPCVACSAEVQHEATKRMSRLRKAARRRPDRPAPA